MGRFWIDLGTILKLPPAEVVNIEDEFRYNRDRAWKVMKRWLVCDFLFEESTLSAESIYFLKKIPQTHVGKDFQMTNSSVMPGGLHFLTQFATKASFVTFTIVTPRKENLIILKPYFI